MKYFVKITTHPFRERINKYILVYIVVSHFRCIYLVKKLLLFRPEIFETKRSDARSN